MSKYIPHINTKYLGIPETRPYEIGYPHKGLCQECHQKRKLTKHHIVPLSEGGSDNLKNIAWLCRPCHDKIHGINGKKHDNE